jgi:hypothetical protein
MSTKMLLLPPSLAISLLATACIADAFDADSTGAGGDLGEAAAATLEWFPLQEGCATSITVAPNDVVWVTGCDGAADHSVWYMLYELSCVDGICAELPAWHDDTGSGNHVAIDRTGSTMAVTSGGVTMAALGRNGSDGITRPTGRWSQLFPFSTDCVNEIEQYAVSNEGALGFETPQYTIAPTALRYLGTACDPDANGNSSVMRRKGQNSAWQTVSGRVKTLALFYRLFGETLSQTFWGLAADGSIWLYDEDAMTFGQMPAPPSYTYDLTDHFAAADDGIYQWNDSAQQWDRYMDNMTVGGPVKQIAHAGAVRVRRKDGTIETVGPSSLWAIDNNGTVYFAGSFSPPR